MGFLRESVLLRIFSFLLSLSFILPHGYIGHLLADDKSDGSGDAFTEEFTRLVEEKQRDPQIQATQLAIEDGLQKIENGQIEELDPNRRDFFLLGEQYLEIGSQRYLLSQFNASLPIVSYNNLQIGTTEDGSLSINAMKGNQVVARHVISKLKVTSFTEDGEQIVFIDQNGHLGSIDRFLLMRVALFKTPVPVFQKLASHVTQGARDPAGVQVSFRTPGMKPLAELEPSHPRHSEVLIPKDSEGRILVRSGDVVVRDESENLLGIYSRKVIYEKVEIGNGILSWLATLANLKLSGAQKDVLVSRISSQMDLGALPKLTDVDSGTRRALEAFDEKQLGSFVAHAKSNAQLAGRNYDVASLEDWQNQYEDILDRAKEQVESGKDRNGKRLSSTELAEYKTAIENGDFSKVWRRVVREEEKSHVGRKVRNALITLGGISAVGVAGAHTIASMKSGYLGEALNNFSPAVFDKSIQVINWLYSFWPAEVLGNEMYRMPLLFGTTALMAIIPLSMAVSWASVPVMKMIGHATKVVLPKMGEALVRKAEEMSQLGIWQRILVASMRVYAWGILPVQHAVIDGVFKQKSFFAAVSQGLNPFKKVKADSLVGKKIGLEKDIRVGFNKIFASKAQRAEQITTRNKAIDALKKQKVLSQRLSQLLALMVVSEGEDVDPATLLMYMSGDLKSDKLKDVFEKPEVQKDWFRLSSELVGELEKMEKFAQYDDLMQMDPRDLVDFYKIAKAKSAEIKNRKSQAFTDLKYRFKQMLRQRKEPLIEWFANFGKFEHEFLKTVVPSELITRQVTWEFIFDHVIVVGYPALWGGRADMSKLGNPKLEEDLAADPHGSWKNIWTPGPRMFDVVTNTIAHFLSAGAAKALVFYKNPPVTEEGYLPYETASGQMASRNAKGEIQERVQGFWRSNIEGIKALHPERSDIGAIYIKDFIRRLGTIQFSILLSYFFRMSIGNAGFEDATRGFLYSFIAGLWYFGWPWNVIFKAIEGDEEHIAAFNLEFTGAKEKIAQGIRLKDNALISEGYNSLFKLLQKDKSFPQKIEEGMLDVEEAQLLLADTHVHTLLAAVGNYAAALETRDEAKIAQAKEGIKALYVEELTDAELSQVLQLSAADLLDYAIHNPPQATKANPLYFKFLTWSAAVGTTILAVPMGVKSFHPEELTNSYLAGWVGISAALYGLSYLFLSKAGYGFIKEKISKILGKNKNDSKSGGCDAALL
jgi:hypothetical protein